MKNLIGMPLKASRYNGVQWIIINNNLQHRDNLVALQNSLLLCKACICRVYRVLELQSTYIPSVSQCLGLDFYIFLIRYGVLSPRRNWDHPQPPLPQAVVPPPPLNQRGGHTRLRVRGGGGPNSDAWRKSLTLRLYSVLGMFDKIRNIWIFSNYLFY